ncbi:MAG: AraC family transcriptional regulator [Firmicutes bacterium]|nr:AraC family transcriptional regulator [Bacillota bacterium]
MAYIFTYRDNQIYSHHSIDSIPDINKFAMHAHEWLEILYVISGKGSYMVEGNQYPVEPHDVFILRPAEMHKLLIEPEVPYERIVIHFSPDALATLDPNHSLLRPFYDRPLGHQNRYSLLSDPDGLLRSAFASFKFDHVPDIRTNLIARLLLLLTALSGLHEHGQLHIPSQGIQSQLVAYVNEHIFENISVQTIADAFYRSKSQISRIFQQATGSSLWDYVVIKRLMAARAMIQRGEPAHDACTACGFSDYSAFYRAYRSHFGNSPRVDAPK